MDDIFVIQPDKIRHINSFGGTEHITQHEIPKKQCKRDCNGTHAEHCGEIRNAARALFSSGVLLFRQLLSETENRLAFGFSFALRLAFFVRFGFLARKLLLELLQIRQHLLCGLVALIQNGVHGFGSDPLELRRDVVSQFMRRSRRAGDVLQSDLLGRVGVKRKRMREHLVHDNAERIQIASCISLQTARLLGSDIMHRSHCGLRPLGAVSVFKRSDAEICDFDDAVFVDHDVLRLDIAMDNAVIMCVLKGLADLRGKERRLLCRELSLLSEILLHCDALDELHHDIVHLLAVADVIYRNDVRMRKHRDSLRLSLEPSAQLNVCRDFIAQDFYGDKAIQPAVQSLKDNRHSAASDNLQDLVTVFQQHSDISLHRLLHV